MISFAASHNHPEPALRHEHQDGHFVDPRHPRNAGYLFTGCKPYAIMPAVCVQSGGNIMYDAHDRLSSARLKAIAYKRATMVISIGKNIASASQNAGNYRSSPHGCRYTPVRENREYQLTEFPESRWPGVRDIPFPNSPANVEDGKAHKISPSRLLS
ncbi:hypothetical protein KCP73_16660 [Salmonella enterica subsp. enterica]|nr:hypothetical protein KCP73_16660 [Salmonella enterica subsp. enterica]